GDTVAVYEEYPGSVTVITVEYDGLLEVFGETRRVWEFRAQRQNTTAYTLTQVADSVGVTWRTGEVSPYYESLVGAIINGTVYGTLSTRKDYGLSYPQEFKLFQNYPNPFNPTTTVEISIPGSGLVTLTVYDLLGREIEAILTQHMVAGHHTVQWNAQDFPSGIYFVRMQAAHFTQTKKVTVLR
ncbi:MAG: T9SS type A sorting domain-containing protein, partial [Fidelibacterota bacterium]